MFQVISETDTRMKFFFVFFGLFRFFMRVVFIFHVHYPNVNVKVLEGKCASV